jgi:hypothetical protein
MTVNFLSGVQVIDVCGGRCVDRSNRMNYLMSCGGGHEPYICALHAVHVIMPVSAVQSSLGLKEKSM